VVRGIQEAAMPTIDGQRVTPRQAEVYEAILSLWRRKLRPPTLRELAAVLEVTSTAVYWHVRDLKKLGLVTYPPKTRRTLTTPHIRVQLTPTGAMLFWEAPRPHHLATPSTTNPTSIPS
jgi:Mn-dependent DtxR family transcriptional regulator